MNDAALKGREAYERRDWVDAYEALTTAQAAGPLDPDDVERLAWSAMLTGHDEVGIEAMERLHEIRLAAGTPLRAARVAFWLGMRLTAMGERARGSGWLARAQRLVDHEGQDCVEQGYLRLPHILRGIASGDFAGAQLAASEAAAIGDRYGEPDLSAFARNLEGRALIRQGRIQEGLPFLDEAIVAVAHGNLSPVVTGLIYCNAIAACQQSYALDRAREWTEMLKRWCALQPQLVQFGGECLIHRSEILQLGGDWPEAIEEARRACALFAGLRDSGAGNAFYQEGEIHRLRGELSEAERAYAVASERGRDPHPGLALLRVAQGRVDLAVASTRRVLSATSDPLQRTRYLPAHVEIMVAASELSEARQAADELLSLAERLGMETLSAMAHHAAGAVALAEGNARGAIDPLQSAQEVWQRVGAPYLSARVRLLLARAFRALGDEDGAALEREAARRVFARLGAAPDLAAVDAMTAPSATSTASPAAAHGLSVRELEVLRLVAAGKTNKAIGQELFLSEKTIDRHVSNIFAKIDVPSRAAATAWAYQHGLVG